MQCAAADNLLSLQLAALVVQQLMTLLHLLKPRCVGRKHRERSPLEPGGPVYTRNTSWQWVLSSPIPAQVRPVLLFRHTRT